MLKAHTELATSIHITYLVFRLHKPIMGDQPHAPEKQYIYYMSESEDEINIIKSYSQ